MEAIITYWRKEQYVHKNKFQKVLLLPLWWPVNNNHYTLPNIQILMGSTINPIFTKTLSLYQSEQHIDIKWNNGRHWASSDYLSLTTWTASEAPESRLFLTDWKSWPAQGLMELSAHFCLHQSKQLADDGSLKNVCTASFTSFTSAW